MKLPLGPHRKVWSSLAESTAWIAMMLSPPGRLSITTGWPHFFWSRSWISRAPMSAPAPGPNGMMKRTGRCGHCCACACTGAASRTRLPSAPIAAANLNDNERMRFLRLLLSQS